MAINAPKKIWVPPEIGNYNIRPTAGAAPELPIQSERRVQTILGAEAYGKLHNKVKESDSQGSEARKVFMKALVKIGGDKLTQTTTVENKEQTLKTIGNNHGVPNLVKLYKDAIEEERKSENYVNAAFLKSIQVYSGGDFNKQQVIIIAGPSGVGKSKVRSELVHKITQGTLDENTDPAKINKKTQHLVVFVDGGIERETSQIRDLMNKTALKLGYAGIEDLEKITTSASTESKVKKFIEKVSTDPALGDLNLDLPILHLVIPTTHPSSDLKQYMKSDSVSEVSYVSVLGNKDAVAYTSDTRAFSKTGVSFPPIDKIDENIRLPESKKPGNIVSFDTGTYLAKAGEDKYIEKQLKKQKKYGAKAPVVLRVTKDLVVINALNEDNQLVKMLITQRQYDAWKTAKTPGTYRNEIELWLQNNTSPELKKELIEVVDLVKKPTPVVMHMAKTETKDEAMAIEERLEKSRTEATEALQLNEKPPLKRQNTPMAPRSPSTEPLDPPPIHSTRSPKR
jgi:hypothetical protein